MASCPFHTVIFLRHGKAANPIGAADRDRPLTPRGQRDAAMTGEWLRTHLPPIDHVLCSTAQRTRETLTAAAVIAPVENSEQIYQADVETLIELLRVTDKAVATLLLVGHSPGVPQTAWALTANHDSPQAHRLSRGFPTSAVAVARFDRPWADIDFGSGELTDLRYAPINSA